MASSWASHRQNSIELKRDSVAGPARSFVRRTRQISKVSPPGTKKSVSARIPWWREEMTV